MDEDKDLKKDDVIEQAKAAGSKFSDEKLKESKAELEGARTRKLKDGRNAMIEARNKELTGDQTPEEMRAAHSITLKQVEPLKQNLKDAGKEVNDDYGDARDVFSPNKVAKTDPKDK